MIPPNRPIVVASRGSALALAQANMVLAQCRERFPTARFELKIIKTTGDKLQAFAPAGPVPEGGKGLFTKELEVALLGGEADLAVHSLKDLPTELPAGLKLGAVSKRADVRDVLVYRDAEFLGRNAPDSEGRRGLRPHATIRDFPPGATVATTSTRRQAQLHLMRPDLKAVPIRGNVGTRLHKLSDQAELDGLVLAAAGFERLGYHILSDGRVKGELLPDGLLAIHLSPQEMLPCVGQAALGIETRRDDPVIDEVCAALDDYQTHHCVAAERAFLHAMGGGCLSPVAAYADLHDGRIRLQAVSFRSSPPRRSEGMALFPDAEALGRRLADELR